MLPKKTNCVCASGQQKKGEPEKVLEKSPEVPRTESKCDSGKNNQKFEESRRVFEEDHNAQIPKKLPKPEKLATIQESESQQIRDLINDLKNSPKGTVCCQKSKCAENSVKSGSFLKLLEKNKCCSRKMCKLAAQICEIYKPHVNQNCLILENFGHFGQGKYHYLLKDASTSISNVRDLKRAISVKIADEIEERTRSAPDSMGDDDFSQSDSFESDEQTTAARMDDFEHLVIIAQSTDKLLQQRDETVSQDTFITEPVARKDPNWDTDISNSGDSVTETEQEKLEKEETAFHVGMVKEEASRGISEGQLDDSLYDLDQDSLEDIAREATEKAAAFRNVEDLSDKKQSMFNDSESKPSGKKFRLSEAEPDDMVFKKSQLDLPTIDQKEGKFSKFFKSLKAKKKEPKKHGRKHKGRTTDASTDPDETSVEDLDRYARRTSMRDANRTSHIEDPVEAKQQELNNILSNM